MPLGQGRHIHLVKLNRRSRHDPEVAQNAVAYLSVIAQNQIPVSNCTSLGGFRSLVNMTQAFEDAFHVPVAIRPLCGGPGPDQSPETQTAFAMHCLLLSCSSGVYATQ